MTEGQFINPFTDVGFKLLFGREVSKPVLISLLNAILEGERKIVDLTFLDKEQVALGMEDRSLIYDVYCETESWEHVVVEMQNKTQDNFVDRTVYYASQAISRQGERGTEWKYKIAGVYCIAFLNFLDKTLEKKFRTDAGILDMETHKVVSRKMRWIYLQLPLFAKEEWGECETDFDRFMLIMKNMEVLKRMPEAARESVFAKLREIADISSLSKEEREKYDYAIDGTYINCLFLRCTSTLKSSCTSVHSGI